MKEWMVFATLICMAISECAFPETLWDIAKRIPENFDGWKADGNWKHYGRKTLFQHIDGGAELYLAYRFKEALVRRYLKPNEMEIAVDIYDMEKPEDAFGVFSVECCGDEVGIGQGSDYIEGLLRFWKGRFFVSILTRLETEESKSAVLKLGRLISAAITTTGELPKIVSLLPKDGLKVRSVRFFRRHTILNRIHFIADRNALRLSDNTEGVFAEYERKGKKASLLLLRYSDAKTASVALNGFISAIMPKSGGQRVVRLENGKWVAANVLGNFLFAILDATTKDLASEMIEALRGALKVVTANDRTTR